MPAKTDRYTTGSFARNGNGLLEAEPPRMHTPAAPVPPRHSSPPAPAQPRLGRLLVVVLVLIAVGVAAGLLPRLHKRAEVVAETRELSVPTVNIVSPVAAKAPPPLVLSGELKPLIDAPIYARATGYVRRWVVDLGAHVEAGQLMAELDIPEIDSQLTANKAAVRQAQAAQTLAEATAKRWTQMLAAKTVSVQEAQEKTSDFDLKTAATETAVANVDRLQQMVGFATIVSPFPRHGDGAQPRRRPAR